MSEGLLFFLRVNRHQSSWDFTALDMYLLSSNYFKTTTKEVLKPPRGSKVSCLKMVLHEQLLPLLFWFVLGWQACSACDTQAENYWSCYWVLFSFSVCHTGSPRGKTDTQSNARQAAGACIARWKGKLTCTEHFHRLPAHWDRLEQTAAARREQECTAKHFGRLEHPFHGSGHCSLVMTILQSCSGGQGELTPCAERLWGSRALGSSTINYMEKWLFTLTF